MGNILITQEGVETSTIEEKCRDESLRNFFEMLREARQFGDCSFMTEAAYLNNYSYGNPYPAFINLSWDEFSKVDSLKGISQSTYNYITNDFQLIYPKLVANETEFEKLNQPKGYGGFEHSDSPDDFLCNFSHWDKWHCNHLTNHPSEIQWESGSRFIPNKKAVYEILQEEIRIYIKKFYADRISKCNNKGQEINIIWNELFDNKEYHENENIKQPMKKNAIALFFHHVVMNTLGKKEKVAYCREIGGKVCTRNYYLFEKELSNLEFQSCGSLRQIYSIVKSGEKQYISLDFHKGMFEFHDYAGRHLGEFLFDETLNKCVESDHNLKSLS